MITEDEEQTQNPVAPKPAASAIPINSPLINPPKEERGGGEERGYEIITKSQKERRVLKTMMTMSRIQTEKEKRNAKEGEERERDSTLSCSLV